MKLNSLVVVVLALAVGGNVYASDRTAAKARELAMLVLPQDSWNKIQAGAAQSVMMQIATEDQRAGKSVPADLAPRVRKAMDGVFSYSEMIDLQTGLLVKYYSASELDQLLRFYRSPVGKKTIRVMPEIQQDVMGIVMSKLSGAMPKMMKELDERQPATP